MKPAAQTYFLAAESADPEPADRSATETDNVPPALIIRHPVTQKHKRVRTQAKARVRIRRLKH